jgi:hypothetical protein
MTKKKIDETETTTTAGCEHVDAVIAELESGGAEKPAVGAGETGFAWESLLLPLVLEFLKRWRERRQS